MKERVISCESYIAEKQCKKGKEGTFWKSCQHCKYYSPIKNGRPAREDQRRKKKEKIQKREQKNFEI